MENDARDVRTILNAGTAFYRVESTDETLRTEVAKVELSEARKPLVTLRYESDPAGLRVFVCGLFRNQSEPSGRVVEFLAEYRDEGHGVVVSTHNLEQFAAADRLISVHDGTVRSDASREPFPGRDLNEFHVEQTLTVASK
jgi:hypothetical protein